MARRKHHTAICAIAKDEDAYVLEWAAYHLALGFDHIYLYDNMSRVPLQEHLSAPEARAHVTVIRWPSIPDRDSQLAAYEHFLWTHGWDVDWTAVIDLDELINLKRHATIGAFLAPFHDATGVALNWRFFGSGGATAHRPGLMMERFTKAAEPAFGPNQTVKAVYRTAEVVRLCHHISGYRAEPRVRAADGTPVANEPQIPVKESSLAVAQINHYFVKSREEWQRKVARGYTWTVADRSEAFAEYDRNECEDAGILARKAETERWMARLASPRARLRRRLASALTPWRR